MPDDKKLSFKNILIGLLIIASLVAIFESFYKFYVKRDYLSVDRIPCTNDLSGCFTSDDNSESPYKVLMLSKSVVPLCTEKNESCDVNKICGDLNVNQCRVIGCNDDLKIIPEGYAVSGTCVDQK